jgi:hypothetical protein
VPGVDGVDGETGCDGTLGVPRSTRAVGTCAARGRASSIVAAETLVAIGRPQAMRSASRICAAPA